MQNHSNEIKLKGVRVRELLNYSPSVLRLHLKNDLIVLFEDSKSFKMTNKEIIILRYLIEIYKVLDHIPIGSNINFILYYENKDKENNGYFSNNSILKSLVNIFYSIHNINDYYDIVCKIFYETVNNIHNELMFHNIDRSVTIVLKDVLEIQLKETILNKIDLLDKTKRSNSEKKNARLIGDIYNEVNDTINNVPNDNCLALMYKAGVINKNQAKKVLGCIGYVTDTNNEIFSTPISSSYTLGMNTPYDIMVESRTGVTASLMSSKGIALSEYFAREQQLCTMYVKSLVKDCDCGSKKGIRWLITEDNINELDGKFYISDDGIKIIRKNDKSLIGQDLLVRSALYCEYPDQQKICLICFGELGYNIPSTVNLGHFCSVNISELISQSILSTKHVAQSAESILEDLDDVTERYFRISDDGSGICLKNNKHYLIIKMEEFKGEIIISNINDDTKIDYSDLSKITEVSLLIEDKKGKIIIKKFVPNNLSYGYLSEHLITHIKNYQYEIFKNNSFIINMEKYNVDLPIIQYPKLQFSSVNLSNKYKKLLNNPEGKTKDQILFEAYNLLKTKFSYSISLIEVVIYSITKNKYNYNLARNCDEEELMGCSKLVSKRNISSMYAWQNITRYVFTPSMFIRNNNLDYNLDVLFDSNTNE